MMSDYCSAVIRIHKYYSEISTSLLQQNTGLKKVLGVQMQHDHPELMSAYSGII